GQSAIKVKYPVFSGNNAPDSLMPGRHSQLFRLKPLNLRFHLIVVLVFKHLFTFGYRTFTTLMTQVSIPDSRASRLPATAPEASCCLHTVLSLRLPSGRNMTSPACRLRQRQDSHTGGQELCRGRSNFHHPLEEDNARRRHTIGPHRPALPLQQMRSLQQQHSSCHTSTGIVCHRDCDRASPRAASVTRAQSTARI